MLQAMVIPAKCEQVEKIVGTAFGESAYVMNLKRSRAAAVGVPALIVISLKHGVPYRQPERAVRLPAIQRDVGEDAKCNPYAVFVDVDIQKFVQSIDIGLQRSKHQGIVSGLPVHPFCIRYAAIIGPQPKGEKGPKGAPTLGGVESLLGRFDVLLKVDHELANASSRSCTSRSNLAALSAGDLVEGSFRWTP
jgi:hypothetical protein